MKRILLLCTFFLLPSSFFLVMVLFLLPHTIHASSIKVTPLKYEEQLELGTEQTGYVDVSNPDDFNVTVTTEVQAFRQINTDGDLEFYEDEQIEEGIAIDVDEFELGPREAARIFFEIDSNQLPEGGVYAALLFGTETPGTDESATIDTTTRVGTLLLLENGDVGERSGEFNSLDLGLWHFGNGINGRMEFTAHDGDQAVAFEPELSTSIPLAGSEVLGSGLVFAGNSREFAIERSGNYFGIFPVTVSDGITGASERQWVVAMTGVWQIIVPLFVIAILLSIALQYYFKKSH